ncbi:MAG: GNAT family N-acetyltransferase [Proteobacteria bacterium]|nr:GNAT family N-acetyltransferase [Pseudomonadota bacterium]
MARVNRYWRTGLAVATKREADIAATLKGSRSRTIGAAHAGLRVRRVRRTDLAQVIEIDARTTGLRKARYWAGVLRRYGSGRGQHWFLVAERAGRIEGYVIGEVRDWEFGAPPCGWVFGINVRPEARVGGIGARLLKAIAAGFHACGVRSLRTLLARDNALVLSFFRSQGLMAAPVIPLEKALD